MSENVSEILKGSIDHKLSHSYGLTLSGVNKTTKYKSTEFEYKLDITKKHNVNIRCNECRKEFYYIINPKDLTDLDTDDDRYEKARKNFKDTIGSIIGWTIFLVISIIGMIYFGIWKTIGFWLYLLLASIVALILFLGISVIFSKDEAIVSTTSSEYYNSFRYSPRKSFHGGNDGVHTEFSHIYSLIKTEDLSNRDYIKYRYWGKRFEDSTDMKELMHQLDIHERDKEMFKEYFFIRSRITYIDKNFRAKKIDLRMWYYAFNEYESENSKQDIIGKYDNIKTGMFANMDELKVLFLPHIMELQTIGSGFFSGLINLDTLVLDQSSFTKGTFDELKNLKYLYLTSVDFSTYLKSKYLRIGDKLTPRVIKKMSDDRRNKAKSFITKITHIFEIENLVFIYTKEYGFIYKKHIEKIKQALDKEIKPKQTPQLVAIAQPTTQPSTNPPMNPVSKPIIGKKFCRQCGHGLRPNTNFCRNCGNKI